MSKLLIERDGDVTRFTLHRPEVHNNVDADLAVELAEGIVAFRDDDAAKVLVVTGAGEETFCAGANLKGMNELTGFGLPLADALQVEVEICHPPVREPEVLAGMASFAAGSRPQPPRPRDQS